MGRRLGLYMPKNYDRTRKKKTLMGTPAEMRRGQKQEVKETDIVATFPI